MTDTTHTPLLRKKDEGAPANVSTFHLVSVLAYYKREEVLKERHLNVLLETPYPPNLTKDSLSQIQHQAIARLGAENGVEVPDIQDIVILNISVLGVMDPATFRGALSAEG